METILLPDVNIRKMLSVEFRCSNTLNTKNCVMSSQHERRAVCGFMFVELSDSSPAQTDALTF